MLAHKDEFYYQNPADLGENLFAWPMPSQGQILGARYSGVSTPQDKNSPDARRKSSIFVGGYAASNSRRGTDSTPAVSGKNVADYWYKTRQYYDYTKNPNVLHAYAGIILT